MNKKIIIKILILTLSILFIYCAKGYAVETGTVRMEITGDTPWVSITIDQAYKECESLDSSTSTLGTDALEPHLTTDLDYHAMGVLAASQYGGYKPSSNIMTPNKKNSTQPKITKYSYTSAVLSTNIRFIYL